MRHLSAPVSYTNSRNFVSAMGESSPPLSYWGPYILSSTTQNIITHQRREENAARGLQYTHGHNVNWTAAIQSCSQGKRIERKRTKKKRVSVSRELFNGKKCHIKYLGFVCFLLLFIYQRKEEKRFSSLFGCGHIFDQSAVSAELRV